jgi:DNA-binding beta-propeller fold protein YncE
VLLAIVLIGCCEVIWPGSAGAYPLGANQPGPIELPTGQVITPTAATGALFQDLDPRLPSAPQIRATRAGMESVSPDGRLLAILTSGGNSHLGPDRKPVPELSNEYVFLFDISGPQPKELQILSIPNTFLGLGWTPSADRLLVSGGTDDSVHEFVRSGPGFVAARTLPLGHKSVVGLPVVETGASTWILKPMAGALAVNPDGTRLLVANFENDSVSLLDLQSGRVITEQDLRPGIIDPKLRGHPGGSYPRAVIWTSTSRAYVASERDREVISLAISGKKVRVVRRMPVQGQPVALLANHSASRLYVALDNTDEVAVFDTAHDTLLEEINVVAPEAVYRNAQKLGGANSNALALTPDERTLLVSNGGENAVAVVQLSRRAQGVVPPKSSSRDRDGDDDDDDDESLREHSLVAGLVPTGWYPTGVATSKDGTTWYIVNGKSETGPNVDWCHELDAVRNTCIAENPPGPLLAENGLFMLESHNQFNWDLERAGFLTLPAPPPLELARLTRQVAHNDHFDNPGVDAKDRQLFTFLREHIHHVIYIIKENRTYDQILGDLEVGNGDPRLTLFPDNIAPNHHAIARRFVTLDNFLVSGEGSWTGWDWSTAARINDFREREEPITAHRGLLGSMWGANRHMNMGYATNAERHAERPISPTDPDILPGARDVAALDGPGGEEGKGYVWDAALRRGLTVRNYGFFGLIDWGPARVSHPFAQGVSQFYPTIPTLIPLTDRYYRGWDPAYPDYWRYTEWKREFAAFSAAKVAPNLMLVQLGNDHLGAYQNAIDGVNTPETQMGDNDYALGLILETVANSPFAADTLVIALEDDTCDGPDHVNAFRSIALIAGPYVRQHAVISTHFTTVSVVKTIEEVLGLDPVGLNDALAVPMSDVFDQNATAWSYQAIVPDMLRSTKLPLPAADHAYNATPRHSAAYWSRVMSDQDFSAVDRVDPATFNHALWRGLKGDAPYPKEAPPAH